MSTHPTRPFARMAAVTVAAGLVAAAPVATSLAASPARPAGLPTITVTMTGSQITVGGTLQSGGVQIVSTVSHEPFGAPAFFRLNPGVTLAQFFAVFHSPAAADPNNLDPLGAIVVDAGAPQGTSWVQADLAPGQYIALDTARGNPTAWPLTTFTVTTAGSPAVLPKPKAAVSAIEFGFRGPGRLHDGQLVRFTNNGFLVHMIVAARGRNLAGAREIARLLRAGKDRQAHRLAVGFTSFAGPLSHSSFQQLTVNVRPGYWVLACFMNTQDGREHTMLGMTRVIQVVR